MIIVLTASVIITGCNKDNQHPEISIKKSSQNEPDVRNSTEVIGNKSKPDNSKVSSLKRISSKEVRKHIGDSLNVTCLVAEVFLNEKVAYLNMENKFPKNIFSCAIFSSKFTEFGDLTEYKDRIVEVTGKISTFRNKPQIILNSKDQIKIIQ